jgi:hypothetical protein
MVEPGAPVSEPDALDGVGAESRTVVVDVDPQLAFPRADLQDHRSARRARRDCVADRVLKSANPTTFGLDHPYVRSIDLIAASMRAAVRRPR